MGVELKLNTTSISVSTFTGAPLTSNGDIASGTGHEP